MSQWQTAKQSVLLDHLTIMVKQRAMSWGFIATFEKNRYTSKQSFSICIELVLLSPPKFPLFSMTVRDLPVFNVNMNPV